jgi:dihydroorotate dehydrogenase
MLYSFIKPILFNFDPESAHNFIIRLASFCPSLGKLMGMTPESRMAFEVGSLTWKFPVGLAAGLDKNAEALDFFNAQGFGALECGTITLKPQEGNPRPRMFRYPIEESLRNAMGFPNKGLFEIIPRLKKYHGLAPLGINLGQNKDTTMVESIKEISILFDTLKDITNYFVINVSSPNTPGLRNLQDRSYLNELFTELKKIPNGPDLYLKLSPDLAQEKIIDLTRLASDIKLTGIIATNTTIMTERGHGGISGLLLKEKSKQVRKIILQEKEDLEFIAVGGISRPHDLFDLWKDGGKAAQVYTAYIYQGPQLLKDFRHEILNFLDIQKITLSDFFKLPLSERKYRLYKFTPQPKYSVLV